VVFKTLLLTPHRTSTAGKFTVKQAAGKSVSRHPYHMPESPQLSSEYRLEACCACSSANLDMRYFVPPAYMQDSLKTPNVKSLEGSDVTTVRCQSLACIELCRNADGVVNVHTGACGKVTVCENALGQPTEGSGRWVNTMLNLRSEITCGVMLPRYVNCSVRPR